MHTMTRVALLAFLLLVVGATQAEARAKPAAIITCNQQGCSDWHNHAAKAEKRIASGKKSNRAARKTAKIDANGNPAYVTVPTAAGIDITVAREFAGPITGFISDLVHQRGYKPQRIKCLSYSTTHVPNSLHYRAKACDFDQRGWGKTAHAMYRVADLAAKWGLRDGGQFQDWGHIDMGPRLSKSALRRASNPPFYGAVAKFKEQRDRSGS